MTDSFCQDCGTTVEKSWTYCRACGSPQPGQTANHADTRRQPKPQPSLVTSSPHFPDRTLGEVAVGVAWRWSLVIALVIGFGYALLYPTSIERSTGVYSYSVDCGPFLAQEIQSAECHDQRMFEFFNGLVLGVIYFLISFAVFYFINRRRVPRSNWIWRPYKRS